MALNEDTRRPLLGVLGGMGPLATVDFLKKLIEETPAERDEDHVPAIVYSVPQIPERPAAILDDGASPLPHMREGVRVLKRAGASVIAIACNTAYHWYDDLQREGVPILHIADATCDELARMDHVRTVGLIATKGTVAAQFFQQRLSARGVVCLLSSDEEQDELVLPAIVAVKRHALDQAHELAVRACERLQARGAGAIILGCTEMPPAIEHREHPVRALCVDPTRALAKACVRWWTNTRELKASTQKDGR